ncbi:hypothetical protein ANO14919_134290 [Xylariales sp. No.14919]|nr:hypothetical protein ANO14919_134290 [Xylariales sp. No.14919]
MLFALTSTLVLAMAASITGHPLESRNTQAGNLNQHLNRRNPSDIPAGTTWSLTEVDKRAGAYDKDIEAADAAEVPRRRVGDLVKQVDAYDEDIAAANPAEVLGN